MDFKDYAINFLMVSLFFIAIVSFAINLGAGYGKSATDMRTEYIETTAIEAQIANATIKTDAAKDAFLSDNIFVASGAFVLNSVWGIIKIIFVVPITIFGIFLTFAEKVFGMPALVTSVITSIIILTLVFLGWRGMRQG
jgi:hypothetical protein